MSQPVETSPLRVGELQALGGVLEARDLRAKGRMRLGLKKV